MKSSKCRRIKKNKQYPYLIGICVIFWILMLLGADPVMAFTGNGATIVHITKTGTCYHESGCPSLLRSDMEICLEDAYLDGYERCDRCNPPRYTGSATREYSLGKSSSEGSLLYTRSSTEAASSSEVEMNFIPNPSSIGFHGNRSSVNGSTSANMGTTGTTTWISDQLVAFVVILLIMLVIVLAIYNGISTAKEHRLEEERRQHEERDRLEKQRKLEEAQRKRAEREITEREQKPETERKRKAELERLEREAEKVRIEEQLQREAEEKAQKADDLFEKKKVLYNQLRKESMKLFLKENGYNNVAAYHLAHRQTLHTSLGCIGFENTRCIPITDCLANVILTKYPCRFCSSEYADLSKKAHALRIPTINEISDDMVAKDFLDLMCKDTPESKN